MNTRITLLYRDANNFKSEMDCIFSGEITRDLIIKIKSNLIDNEDIIAEQVGLPTPAEMLESFPSDADHPLTTLEGFLSDPADIDIAGMLTWEEPTIHTSIQELAEDIAAATWNEQAEIDRLEIPFD